ncbi:hypothetical protein CEXT_357961 [Caerostris extrusa]|uniref:Uncharacterized protein n=1 Tax=Caerostris extrusa TaxID=172846 RepID=A0AAV4XTL4_CAEEX|nr:hypothetical protein CEXT_357961 [Caerostris extrusa]
MGWWRILDVEMWLVTNESIKKNKLENSRSGEISTPDSELKVIYYEAYKFFPIISRQLEKSQKPQDVFLRSKKIRCTTGDCLKKS